MLVSGFMAGRALASAAQDKPQDEFWQLGEYLDGTHQFCVTPNERIAEIAIEVDEDSVSSTPEEAFLIHQADRLEEAREAARLMDEPEVLEMFAETYALDLHERLDVSEEHRAQLIAQDIDPATQVTTVDSYYS